MSKVRAKFKCDSVEEFEFGKNAKLSAVTSLTDENKDFTDSTPNGSLSITIYKDYPASNFFEPGQDYYLDFTKVE